ncbi:hypothetical protein RFI_32258, partial [Reticulomyxa filosa]
KKWLLVNNSKLDINSSFCFDLKNLEEKKKGLIKSTYSPLIKYLNMYDKIYHSFFRIYSKLKILFKKSLCEDNVMLKMFKSIKIMQIDLYTIHLRDLIIYLFVKMKYGLIAHLQKKVILKRTLCHKKKIKINEKTLNKE